MPPKTPTGLRSLTERAERVLPGPTLRSTGRIAKIVGLTLESHGPETSLGDLVALRSQQDAGGKRRLAQVVGFRGNRVLLTPYESVSGLRVGDRVDPVSEGFRVPVGDGLLGRIVDAFGHPLDAAGNVRAEQFKSTEQLAPSALSRPRIDTHLPTGVRAIDAAVPCGRGQRLGIFAGSGVGKSTLLGMLCRHAEADVNVIALVGERGKEVRDFIEGTLGADGLAKSVIVTVTSDRPAMQRVKAPETAMTIAEHFRDSGRHVLLVMDSLTRYAMAQREIGLAVGEPPATRGYPPSVFSLLPRLLERAGTSSHGSITGFFTVLVEGDDMNDPIADTVRAIVDGHVVLSRELATEGHYPPVDIPASISRCANEISTPEQLHLARALRHNISVYRRAADMIAIGAYKQGNDPEIDRAVALKPQLDRFLRQELDDPTAWSEGFQQLRNILPDHENISQPT